MKTIRKLLVWAMLCLYLSDAYSQNLVNNPSFETYSNNSSCGPDYYICQATDWKILLNSPDVLNSFNISIPGNAASHQPRTGDANARFASPPNGMSEYFYGSTQPLTAGQTYIVSFWVRQDYFDPASGSVGMHIGASVPSSQIQAIVPQIVITPTSTQYVRAYTCYTATTTGIHYLTFGPFGGGGNGVWLLDDVSVEELNPVALLPDAVLSIPQTTYCTTDAVIANGANSINETSYQWDLYRVVNGTQVLVYSSGEMMGQAGTFSTAVIPGFFPHDGECYNLYLSTFGICKDRTFVDFCYMYPTIDFITDGSPVCENIPVDLQVTGDNGWTYTWNTGQSGVGLKTVSVTPTVGNSTYTVTVTTPQGCTSTKTITLVVNSQDNLPPWMDGINGTGEYTYYVSQGDAVFFNSLLSNDHLNENITITTSTTIPPGYAVITPTGAGTVLSLSWATSLSTPTGEYHYYLTADDKNSCGAGINTFDFRIIVVCDQCPVCLNYEDRSPSGTPLPAETKAGKCIEAGLSQTVSTGEANVLFQAGAYILEGPNFEAGPGYEGVIEPSTCVTDCEDCCNDWAGFTYDELPNPYYMNLSDNDPTNDIFQLTDIYHPFCAFGAKGYHLEILRRNASNDPINSNLGMSTSACCAFESPAPENPIPHSSIWWDGYMTNMWGNQTQPQDGVLTYMIELYGCNGEELILHGDIQFYGDASGMAQNTNGQNANGALSSPLTPEQQEQAELRERLDKKVNLYPNPAIDIVIITGAESRDLFYQVFDEKGVMLSLKEKAVNQRFSLADYSSGTYYVRIYSGTVYVVRKVVKL